MSHSELDVGIGSCQRVGRESDIASSVVPDRSSHGYTHHIESDLGADSKPSSSTGAMDAPAMRHTLIVCPPVMIAAWEQAVKDCLGITPNIYHGSSKQLSTTSSRAGGSSSAAGPGAGSSSSSSSRGGANDRIAITITSYQTFANNKTELDRDRSNRANPRPWHRVILDEAHEVRNKNTKTSAAVSEIRAEIRWAVSGTPITNSVQEFFPLLRFLKIAPFDTWDWFHRLILRPINMRDVEGLNTLNLLLKPFLLRRTKRMKIVVEGEGKSGGKKSGGKKITTTELLDLPPKESHIISVPLEEEEQRPAYLALFDLCQKSAGEEAMRNGGNQLVVACDF